MIQNYRLFPQEREGRNTVTGKPRFAIDHMRDGMLNAMSYSSLSVIGVIMMWARCVPASMIQG